MSRSYWDTFRAIGRGLKALWQMRAILPEWRYWPALALVGLIALSVAGFFVTPHTVNLVPQVSYTPPNNESYKWIRELLWSAAFWTAAFTGALTLSTYFLWRETRRLAEGADDQAKKMVRGINATLSVANATRASAEAMDETATAMRAVAAQTERLAIETSHSAKAAEAALELTREATHAELRAYVFPSQAEVVITPGEPYSKMVVCLTLRNFGKTPARMTGSTFSADILSPITKKTEHGRTIAEHFGQGHEWGEHNIAPGGEKQYIAETSLRREHFVHEPRYLPVLNNETRFSCTIEFSYLDYLKRAWGEYAQFRTENVEWDGTTVLRVPMQQMASLSIDPAINASHMAWKIDDTKPPND